MKIRITEADAEFFSQICAIENASFSDPWSEQSLLSAMEDPLCDFILAFAENGDVPVGYAIMRSLFEEGEILSVAVRADCRRLGIGRSMMQHLLSLCKAKGVESLFLEVRESNTAARELYSSLGFAPIGKRRGYYVNPREDAVIMRAAILPNNDTLYESATTK